MCGAFRIPGADPPCVCIVPYSTESVAEECGHACGGQDLRFTDETRNFPAVGSHVFFTPRVARDEAFSKKGRRAPLPLVITPRLRNTFSSPRSARGLNRRWGCVNKQYSNKLSEREMPQHTRRELEERWPQGSRSAHARGDAVDQLALDLLAAHLARQAQA